jgi:hypothetical protein
MNIIFELALGFTALYAHAAPAVDDFLRAVTGPFVF